MSTYFFRTAYSHKFSFTLRTVLISQRKPSRESKEISEKIFRRHVNSGKRGASRPKVLRDAQIY